jgi:plastocyanin
MHRTRPSLALVILALAVGGCGDSGAPVRERDGSFTVTLDEYFLRPQEIRVPKGRQLTITVVNKGRLGHTFRIGSINHNVLRIDTLRPGEQKSRTFKLAAGNYRMFCVLANHEELGMRGSLTVG